MAERLEPGKKGMPKPSARNGLAKPEPDSACWGETRLKKSLKYELDNATQFDWKEIMQLVEDGADVETRNFVGRTALMIAAACGENGVCRNLLHKGAKINAQDDNGETALMLAADFSHGTECRLLINRGADMKIKDKDGSNVFRHAFLSNAFVSGISVFDDIMMGALGKWFGMKYADIFMANARECVKG